MMHLSRRRPKIKLSRFDVKMAHIDSLLRFLRYCSYPIYPTYPHLIVLDYAAKQRREKLRIIRVRTNTDIHKALKAHYPHNNLTLYLGEDENGVLTFFDSSEEANEAHEKFKKRNRKLTLINSEKMIRPSPDDSE